MNDDLREKLSRMTVKNGASLNEERIAREKIAKYAGFMKKEKTVNWKKAAGVINATEEDKPFHEQQFLREWYKIKMENRKKWKVE